MKPLHSLTDEEFAERARRAAALPDAPPALIQRAIGAWSARPAAAAAPASSGSPLAAALAGLQAAARQLVAVLSFDSWAVSPLAAGMRSARPQTRQLLFSADGRDVDLRISAADAPGRFLLTGQVLGPDEAGVAWLAPLASAAASLGAEMSHTGPLDAMGEFRLDGVPAGRYRLMLRVGSDEIELPAIELGQAQP